MELIPDTPSAEGSRNRTRGTRVKDAVGSLVTGMDPAGTLYEATALDARFGIPTTATRTAASGAATVTTPVNARGDIEGPVAVNDATYGNVLTGTRAVNADGVLLSETDGVGRTTVYSSPNGWGLMTVADVTSSGGEGRATLHRTFEYDGQGRLTAVKDDLGRGETWSFDSLGRQTGHSILGSPAESWSWSYAQGADELTVTESLSGTSHRRVTVYREGRPRSETVIYDQGKTATRVFTWVNGRQTRVELQQHEPERPVTWSYGFDGQGRVTSVKVLAEGVERTTTYNQLDGENKPASVTDANGHTTTLTYDILGRRQGRPNHVSESPRRYILVTLRSEHLNA